MTPAAFAQALHSPPVRHLLVDLDGTLLGNRNLSLSYDFARQALAALRKHVGWRSAVRALLAVKREFDRPHAELTNDLRVVAAFSQRLNVPIEEGRRILKEGVSTIFPSLRRHFFPVEGSRDFLEWAKARYPLTLATNPVWPPEIVELRVRWAGIDPAIFGAITHIRRMHACKPTQEYYEEILSQQGLKAEECLLIGDDVKMDLPATRVGIRVFIVGRYKNVTPLRHTRSKAPAWRGSYASLREALELIPRS